MNNNKVTETLFLDESDLSPEQFEKRSKNPNSIETLTFDPKILNKSQNYTFSRIKNQLISNNSHQFQQMRYFNEQ